MFVYVLLCLVMVGGHPSVLVCMHILCVGMYVRACVHVSS